MLRARVSDLGFATGQYCQAIDPSGRSLGGSSPNRNLGATHSSAAILSGWRVIRPETGRSLNTGRPGRGKEATRITDGALFRSINKTGRVCGNGITPKVLWEVVREAASRAGIEKLTPHDLRRTCARLCHLADGELDQIRFLLGHVSIQTTERYLRCKQKLREAVKTEWASSRKRAAD